VNNQNEQEAFFERFRNVKLVNVSKVCPDCGRTNYMGYIFTEVHCSCGGIVAFTLAEKRHIVKTEIHTGDLG
jgi:hypothetical protein